MDDQIANRGGRDRAGDNDPQRRRLDMAARAAWLYFIAGNTQDEIAAKLQVSRPGAQRLVALAVAEKLIRFRPDHRIAACMELAEALRDRYGLEFCDVIPSDGAATSLHGLAISAAGMLERQLAQKAPLTLTFGTGRTLRAVVREIAPMEQPQHKVVSVVGNITRDGRASPYEVVMRLADRIGAQCYPLPTPVIAESVEQRRFLLEQHWAETVRRLADTARIGFFGVSNIGWNSPLHVDGFITDEELAELIRLGAVGEIAGWAFDRDGRLIEGGTNERVTALPLAVPPRHLTVGIAGGPEKVLPIRAALAGRFLSGLITDEATAKAVLADQA